MTMLDEIIANVTQDGASPLNMSAAKRIAKIFAEAVAEDALKRAAQRAIIGGNHIPIVDKQSILSTPINTDL